MLCCLPQMANLEVKAHVLQVEEIFKETTEKP